MKKLALLLIMFGCSAVYATTYLQCCQNDQIIKQGGYCTNDTKRINLNCNFGHMLLRDIVLDGPKVSTKDTPNFVIVEDPKVYCIGEMYRNSSNHKQGLTKVAVACFQKELKPNSGIETSGVLTLISVVFLLATFAIYSYLPQLRDLQGLCYMCLCISMAIGFMSLGILQLSPGFRGGVCTATGFLVYFWMMATFFWTNVICINVYRTIVDASYLKKTERRQYFIYSSYAWGLTILFFIIALVTNFVEGDHWKPGIGVAGCWLNGRTETWIFFYGPVAILIVINILLFMLSSYTLLKHTRNYEVSKLNNLKYKSLLSFKLFLVMGISWAFEIISFAHAQAHIIWKIMDIFNCLQGVIIFFILVVLRKRVVRGLAKQGCCLFITNPLIEKLSPHDESCDQQILDDENAEVRLN